MVCGCQKCKKLKGTRKRVPAVMSSIMYLLGKTKAPKKTPSFATAKKKIKKRRKRGGKFIKNKKVTKVPKRRVKIIGQKRKKRL